MKLSSLHPLSGARWTPQLHCVVSHPQQNHLIAAGSSDGRLFVWDVRKPVEPASPLDAHFADIWGVQFSETKYGHLLSCSSDGTLQARRPPCSLPDAGFFGASNIQGAFEDSSRELIRLGLPINSFDVHKDYGCLVAASDAEVLTFIDGLR